MKTKIMAETERSKPIADRLSRPSGETSLVMERLGRIEDLDRSFDIAYWQAQDATARMSAAWDLVVFYHRLKGSTDELRLQRSVESLQRRER